MNSRHIEALSAGALESRSKATPHNAIKEKNGEQPTRKQLEALLNLFARQQQIKPSDRVCQRGSDLPMRAGYSLLQFAFASLGSALEAPPAQETGHQGFFSRDVPF